MDTPTAFISSSCFPTTQWTQVITVLQQTDGEEAWRALSEFCKLYRPAVYHFFRRRGYPHERAEDYTQDFLAERILRPWEDGDGMLHRAQPGENRRFRSFLSHVLWRFLQDKWKHEHRQSGGGGATRLVFEDGERDGDIGSLFSLQQSPFLSATNTPWQTLTTLTFTNRQQLYLDTSALSGTNRFYRASPPVL